MELLNLKYWNKSSLQYLDELIAKKKSLLESVKETETFKVQFVLYSYR